MAKRQLKCDVVFPAGSVSSPSPKGDDHISFLLALSRDHTVELTVHVLDALELGLVEDALDG